jgi:hypothetical protein
MNRNLDGHVWRNRCIDAKSAHGHKVQAIARIQLSGAPQIIAKIDRSSKNVAFLAPQPRRASVLAPSGAGGNPKPLTT